MAGWATSYICDLKEGKVVSFRPRGNSMVGKINSGDLCTLEPINSDIEVGDIVLCKVNGNQYLHLVSDTRGNMYQISNNKGHINGWVSRSCIYGKCVKVES